MELGYTEVSDVAGTSVLALHGEHDLATEPEIRRAIARLSNVAMVIDLSAATFIDSSVIKAIILAHTHATIALAVTPGSFTERVLELTGVREIVPTFESRSAAVDFLRPPVPAA